MPGSGIDFSEETDADLLGYMALAEEEIEASRDAFAEFWERHARWRERQICARPIARLVGGYWEVQDVVAETFRKVFVGAKTFKADSSCIGDGGQRRARAWLGGIANNVIYDGLRAEDCVDGAVPLDEVWPPPSADPFGPSNPETDKVRWIREALEALTEREQDVVLEMLLHYKIGAKQQRLPNTVSAALCEKWETTPENIRVIRMRALRKMRQTVESRSETKEVRHG